MPCYDSRSDGREEVADLGSQLDWYKAALCATTSALQKTYDDFSEGVSGHSQNSFIDTIDFKEAGINKKDFVKWKTNMIAKMLPVVNMNSKRPKKKLGAKNC